MRTSGANTLPSQDQPHSPFTVEDNPTGHQASSYALTVILTFYKRVDYIGSALESLAQQTLHPSHFEVIVVGPEPLPDLIPYFPNVSFIPCGDRSLGSKFAAGIERATSDVIVLLEDDDRFHPSKLSHILNLFSADPELVYFQNGVRAIDRTGAASAVKRPHARLFSRWERKGVLTITGRPDRRALRLLQTVPAGFNNSSIAVRREMLRKHIRFIRCIDLAVDRALLYVALTGEGRLTFDPVKLTELRLHPESSSRPSGGNNLVRQELLTEHVIRNRADAVKLHELTLSVGPSALEREARSMGDCYNILVQLRGHFLPKRLIANSLLSLATLWPTSEARNRWGLFPLGVLALGSPRLATKVYSLLRGFGYQ